MSLLGWERKRWDVFTIPWEMCIWQRESAAAMRRDGKGNLDKSIGKFALPRIVKLTWNFFYE